MTRARKPVYITRRSNFCASHRYHNPAWSDKRNREIFGPCNNPYGHGHNYEIEVTVKGEIDPETGMVINLTEIDGILQQEIISTLDHRYINKEVPEFDATIPTTENLALFIWKKLNAALAKQNARLHRVRLFETPDLYVEYLGEEGAT